MEVKYRELHRVALTAIIYKDHSLPTASEAPSRKVRGSESLLPEGGQVSKKYLIVKRSPLKKSFPGRWTVPGGGLEVDDYISLPKTTSDAWYFAVTESLRREIREEVGIEVGKARYLLDLTFIRPDGIPVVVLSYFCDWKRGEVKLNEENTEYKWVTFEEAKKYNLISGILGEIEMVDKILKGEDAEKISFNNI